MSTHGTRLWLETEDRHGCRAWVDVAEDVSVDLCCRLSVGEGDPGKDFGQEIHMTPDQAEAVAKAIMQVVTNHRTRGSDPTWAARTLVLEWSP